MSFEEEFDRIIRQKADEAGFPFDEKNWEKARGMLDAEKAAVGIWSRSRMYMIALFVLILGVGTWLLMPLGTTPALADAAVTVKKQAKTENRNLATDEASYYQIIHDAPAQVNETRSTHNDTRIHKFIAAKTFDRKVEAQTNSAASRPIATVSEARVTSAGEHLATDTNSPIEKDSEAEGVAARTEQNTEPVITVAPIETRPEVTAIGGSAADQAQQESAVSNQEALAYQPLIPVYSSLPEKEYELMPVAFHVIKGYDDDYYNQKKIKTHYLNVEAGGTYLAGWDVKGGKDGKGFNAFAGFNYGLYLSKKISVSAGLQAYNISHISKPFYINTKTEFGFGSASTFTVITSSSLFYAAVPLKINYHINAQNQVGLGVNMGMLVNATNSVETYGTSDNVKAVKTSNNGTYKGINNTNVMLSAFYKTQVTNRLYVNAEVIYGLSDIFENLAATNNERVLGLRLGLQYTLFDK